LTGYYDEKLAAGRLRRVYELAPPRVRRYLTAEASFVAGRVRAGDRVLELGCGYGRVLPLFAAAASLAVGIDTSTASLALARAELAAVRNVRLVAADAARLALRDDAFDVVACIQNGISAFHVAPRELAAEALRVTRPSGAAIFSSYAASFWPERLAWFELQAAAGLLGEIDYERTRDGVIVCKDGFTATTFGPAAFAALAASLGVRAAIEEIDASSVCCTLFKPR
jgi:SAM-dependent methyltransferase